MSGEQTKNDDAATAASDAARKNERSSVDFPYNDLDSAIVVIRAVHENAGHSCTLDQLAAYLQMASGSGGFRARIAPVRVFGLAEIERATLTLTDIGQRILDPVQEKAARVDAFLQVELYKKVYDKFRGVMLPPAAALEREMAAMGVSEKQKDKARQVFERSASQAGFFAHGKERLVMPALAPRNEPRPETPADTAQVKLGGGGGTPPTPPLDPIIQALVAKIPPANGEPWSAEDQVTWLKMMSMAFGMIYKTNANITVSVSGDK